MEIHVINKLFFVLFFTWSFFYFIGIDLNQKKEADIVQPHIKFLLEQEENEALSREMKNTKILIPALIYGPNNQYQGFRESLVIAKILDRKIGVPPFFRHYTSKGEFSLPPSEIFDISLINSSISVASDVHQSCSENRFDLIFNTHQNWKDTRYIKNTYSYFGLDFLTYNETKKVDLVGPKEDFQREISEQFLQYDNIDCVMLKQPFGIIDWNKLAKNRLRASQLYNYEFIDMILDIIRSTRRSKKIQDISEQFLLSKNITHFVSLHWRYDLNDFIHLNSGENKKSLVDKIKAIRGDPSFFVKWVVDKMKKINGETILLFSPPSDYNFLKNLTSHLITYYPEAEIIEEQEISDFAKSRLSSAYFDTQLSLLSQELAFKSDFFFYSNPSTWSANVVLERLAADKFGEEMILDFEMPEEDNCSLGTRLGKKDEFDVFPLVSFAGSGNTWTRMLLEKSTGIYTGSIYNDKSLYEDGLYGEYTYPTDGTTLFQKAHNIDNKSISSAKGYLFLIRNPFEAVIAEFKRRKGKGHTSSVSESVFEEDDWIKQGTKFLGWWHNLMLKIISKKKENMVPMHIFFYEDLKINATREMAKILDFVEGQKYYTVPDRDRRLLCLEKSLKETEKFHRPKAPSSFEYFSNAMIDKGNQFIDEIHNLFEENNLPIFDKQKYFRKKSENNVTENSNNLFNEIPLTADLNLWKNECNRQDGVIFLKKHKTASTTFKGIIDKWLKINGVFNEIEKPQMGPQGGCFPAQFNERCWEGNKRHDPVLGISYHFRWNMDYLPSIFDSNRERVKIFTTIRDPLATFRSTYNYFYQNSNGCEYPCWGTPFKTFLSDYVKDANKRPYPSIEEFLDILPKAFNSSVPFAYRVSNPQSFELGMDFDKINDITYVKESLSRLDSQFDLVLITEYFWEGIVLLRHLLCAEYEHLYLENKNERHYKKELLNSNRQAVFEDFHKADILMYNYFNASLHRK